MKGPLIAVIDWGTSGLKVLLVDPEGKVCWRGSRAIPFSRGAAGGPTHLEFSPEGVWGEVGALLRAAAGEVGARRIQGVTATSFRGGFVFLDGSGRELHATANLDRRPSARPPVDPAEWGPRLHRASGYFLDDRRLPYRLWWLQQHDPGRYGALATVLHTHDWLLFRLGGQPVADATSAPITTLFDLEKAGWHRGHIEALGFARGWFPPPVSGGETIGRVGPAVAAHTGLLEGTAVVTSGADTHCALVGTGGIEDGAVVAVAGSTLPVQRLVAWPPAPRAAGLPAGGGNRTVAQNRTVADSPPFVDQSPLAEGPPLMERARRLWGSCFVQPWGRVLESNGGITGLAYQWLRRTFGGGDGVWQAVRAPEEAGGRPVSLRTLSLLGPTLGDARRQAGRPGALLGIHVWGHEATEVRDIARAFWENVAFAVRANAGLLAEAAGPSPQPLRFCGGLAAVPGLPQLVADVLGGPVLVPETVDATAVGAAACGAVALGWYRDLAGAVQAMVRWRPLVEPAAPGRYEEAYARWFQWQGASWDGPGGQPGPEAGKAYQQAGKA